MTPFRSCNSSPVNDNEVCTWMNPSVHSAVPGPGESSAPVADKSCSIRLVDHSSDTGLDFSRHLFSAEIDDGSFVVEGQGHDGISGRTTCSPDRHPADCILA